VKRGGDGSLKKSQERGAGGEGRLTAAAQFRLFYSGLKGKTANRTRERTKKKVSGEGTSIDAPRGAQWREKKAENRSGNRSKSKTKPLRGGRVAELLVKTTGEAGPVTGERGTRPQIKTQVSQKKNNGGRFKAPTV